MTLTGQPSPSPTVYRTRAYRIRQRALIGLAAVALVLLGYLIGRWQNSPEPIAAAPTVAGGPPSATAEPSPTQTAEPTVYATIQAESAAVLNGVKLEDSDDDGGGKDAGYIANGDSMRFDNVDFGPVPATKAQVRLASAADADRDGRVEIRLDTLDSAAVGSLRVTPTGGWQDWRTDEIALTPVTGVHTVFLVFVRNDDDEFVNVNWLLFEH